MCKCENCLRSYDWTDQCNVPACGIPYKKGTQYFTNKNSNFEEHVKDAKSIVLSKYDEKGYDFIKNNSKWIHFTDETGKQVIGQRFTLNKNEDCYFYKTLPKRLLWILRIRQCFNKFVDRFY